MKLELESCSSSAGGANSATRPASRHRQNLVRIREAVEHAFLLADRPQAGEQAAGVSDESDATGAAEDVSKGTVAGPATTLIAEERVVVGALDWRLYTRYFGFASGWTLTGATGSGVCILSVLLPLIAWSEMLRLSGDYFLSLWSQDNENGMRYIALNGTALQGADKQYESAVWMQAYGALSFAIAVFSFIRTEAIIRSALQSARSIHDYSLAIVVKARVPTFFDVTAVGTVLNRLSRDVVVLDCVLSDHAYAFLEHLALIAGVVIVCASTTWGLLLVLLPIMKVFAYCRKYFSASSRELNA